MVLVVTGARERSQAPTSAPRQSMAVMRASMRAPAPPTQALTSAPRQLQAALESWGDTILDTIFVQVRRRGVPSWGVTGGAGKLAGSHFPLASFKHLFSVPSQRCACVWVAARASGRLQAAQERWNRQNVDTFSTPLGANAIKA